MGILEGVSPGGTYCSEIGCHTLDLAASNIASGFISNFRAGKMSTHEGVFGTGKRLQLFQDRKGVNTIMIIFSSTAVTGHVKGHTDLN